ncbi:RING finger protein B [Symbiodinium microadriaticum]|uniref:RING finger protein B n=2 Tax=Symbiodinium TaxID=2949 RepID=A0A1Q9E1X6_SYMMI|nr:RING finger protein B [Symbiodinium microadriaticum]|mmetsp:Transcript_23659/g.56114  ORF Transcript_23659/g.56114 Transcript_23659/m.56114 type:complete len:291 (+) Transcript_23659:66-938(+)
MEVEASDEDFWERVSSAEPSQGPTPLHTPRSPSELPQSPHGVFLSQPASIDEPLLLLDEDRVQERHEAERVALHEELEEARRTGKADRAAAEAMSDKVEELQREREDTCREKHRLEKENEVLRLQLQDHHGIMAAEWGQTLQFQERLRQEEAEVERLAFEVAELRAALVLRDEELGHLRRDAAQWRLLSRHKSGLGDISSDEIERVLEEAGPGLAQLEAESRARARVARSQLRDELEQQLCAVCRDSKKAVLFLPCQHLCVCEGCRQRLRPYRCPMCQEPIQSHISRVHF